MPASSRDVHVACAHGQFRAQAGVRSLDRRAWRAHESASALPFRSAEADCFVVAAAAAAIAAVLATFY